jgi:peroxiredoxin
MKVFEEQVNRLKVGQEADSISLDENLYLSNFRGHPILLVFWKTLWQRCQQEAPVIEKEIWQSFRDKGLKVFAIGLKENAEQASSWTSQHGLTYPLGLDPDGGIYKKFGAGSVPYHVVIDRDFRISLSQEDFEKDLLIKAIQDALRGAWTILWNSMLFLDHGQGRFPIMERV